MKSISDFIFERTRLSGSETSYDDLVSMLEQDPKMEKIEGGGWENESGEYNFHNVDRDYKYEIFKRLSGGRRKMENRYLYGPDSNSSEETTVMVSGVYSGKFPEIPVAVVHFGSDGLFDQIDIVNLYPNGELARYVVSDGKDIKELEKIIK